MRLAFRTRSILSGAWRKSKSSPNSHTGYTTLRKWSRLELEANSEEIRNYQELVRHCETRNDYALAEQMRGILRNEQQHQMDQAAALAKDLTDVRIFL